MAHRSQPTPFSPPSGLANGCGGHRLGAGVCATRCEYNAIWPPQGDGCRIAGITIEADLIYSRASCFNRPPPPRPTSPPRARSPHSRRTAEPLRCTKTHSTLVPPDCADGFTVTLTDSIMLPRDDSPMLAARSMTPCEHPSHHE